MSLEETAPIFDNSNIIIAEDALEGDRYVFIFEKLADGSLMIDKKTMEAYGSFIPPPGLYVIHGSKYGIRCNGDGSVQVLTNKEVEDELQIYE